MERPRTRPPDIPGEGMGLAYVKAVVQRLSGYILFESVLGEGCTFSVDIPDSTSERLGTRGTP